MAKTVCTVSRDQFAAGAKATSVEFGGLGSIATLLATPHEFKTGSFGWYANGKIQLHVGDQVVTVQVGLNMTVVGSKDMPQVAKAA